MRFSENSFLFPDSSASLRASCASNCRGFAPKVSRFLVAPLPHEGPVTWVASTVSSPSAEQGGYRQAQAESAVAGFTLGTAPGRGKGSP